ncbi:hypothetical protein [[Clostridium] fimetarium]|uniref:Lactaldehyde reductase n=1 Tax=[Clostridium] fimetarium TaxID=99656 RepID=A0A1I0NCX8_9FIRM|nr:hypothetical protein [[Clostridium] fimetarium]SEV99039.1 lactaldehyde reductase [[Clostridium] fimetarium]
MFQSDYRTAAFEVVKTSKDVAIHADLKTVVREEDIPFLAQSGFDDAYRPGNPKKT